jgi:hypothetical protein
VKRLQTNFIEMKNSILIIGCGNMGLSHFKSFEKKKYKIYIIEKKNNVNINIIKKNLFINKKIFFLKKIPKNKNYLLTIISSKSKERYSIIKTFFDNHNTSKFLLLEKFCFFELNEFYKFKKKFSFKTKTFINSWAHILISKMQIKNNIKNFNVTCHIQEGSLLSNITHILHFFCFLNKDYFIKKIHKEKYKLVKNLKYKSYNELNGTLIFNNSRLNKLLIKTKKKLSHKIIFYIEKKKPNIQIKIIINNDIKIFKIRKKSRFKFPLSSQTSSIFLKKCLSRKFYYMPSFKNDYLLSRSLLKGFGAKIP